MKYQLLFSPRLGVSPREFISVWNEDADAHAIGQMHLELGVQKSYNDPLIETIWLITSTVGMGIATNALYDIVKKTLLKQKQKKRIKFTKLDQPDGTHLLIFEEEEV